MLPANRFAAAAVLEAAAAAACSCLDLVWACYSCFGSCRSLAYQSLASPCYYCRRHRKWTCEIMFSIGILLKTRERNLHALHYSLTLTSIVLAAIALGPMQSAANHSVMSLVASYSC